MKIFFSTVDVQLYVIFITKDAIVQGGRSDSYSRCFAGKVDVAAQIIQSIDNDGFAGDIEFKKLPIGISSFSEIISGGYVYVDKTPLIRRMIGEGRYNFLSRARRMGKSLLVNTLKELFEGNEVLFRGLHIHPQHDWTEKHPVIRLTFAQGNIADVEDLYVRIRTQFNYLAQEHKLTLPQANVREQFEWLLRTLKQQHGTRVVVLIDEYDKPILDRIAQPELDCSV